jgi:L-asparaginase II
VTPVLAEVVRSGLVESRHRGSIVALDADGSRLFVAGDVDTPVYPRSSLKPLQALGMLRSGWQPDDDRQIALAAASHSGEPAHIDVVRRILTAAGLDASALDNTPDLPLDRDAAHALIRVGGAADPLHQNCSGKHAAMLATCVAAGWPTADYRSPDHPLQVAIRRTVEDLTGEVVATVAVDGCGAPLFALSLAGLARGFSRLITATADTAATRVADAMRAHPFLVGGTGRDVTLLMTQLPGLLAKDGAEGVYAAALPDGTAVALKIDDGAGRARAPVMIAALRRLGAELWGLETLEAPPVLGHGQPVGSIRSTLPPA